MIMTIGIMLGMFIITQCAYIGGKEEVGLFTRILAGVAALVAILGLISLFVTGVIMGGQ